MKYAVLAEKPNQAEDYAKALGDAKKVNGNWQVYSNLLNAQVIVTSAVGHLVELVNPYDDYENWQMENLPVLPETFDYKVAKGNTQQMNLIKAAMKEADQIIVATDPDREGEAIAYRILNKIPGAIKKTNYRLWCNSLTPQGIQKAFSQLREARETRAYAEEAEARAISDWLVGFNMSPWTTLKMREQGYLEKYDKVMTVGRVQTPITALIVKNDEEIENFVPEPFWQIQVIDQAGTVFSNEIKYKVFEEAQTAISALEDLGLVKSLITENKRTASPKLFNLTQLQSVMSQKYQIDAADTLKIAQALYQKKFTSYPRTDSHYITENEFAYLKANVKSYQRLIDLEFEVSQPSARNRYVNDKKVVEHYALIPTEKLPNLDQLNQEERLVYYEITQRMLLMFASDYTYQATQVELEVSDQTFKATGNVTADLGWRAHVENESKDKILPQFQEGQQLKVETNIKVDKTKPPTRLTEAILLDKVLPKYNLGTSATRAGILENIKKREYISLNKKNGHLKPTERGRLLVIWLNELGILYTNPDMTSKWEEYLVEIGQGQRSKDSFIDQTKKALIAQMQKG